MTIKIKGLYSQRKYNIVNWSWQTSFSSTKPTSTYLSFIKLCFYIDFRAAEKSFVCASCSRRGKVHQQYSAEVAKVLAQLNSSEDRKTATSKVQGDHSDCSLGTVDIKTKVAF